MPAGARHWARPGARWWRLATPEKAAARRCCARSTPSIRWTIWTRERDRPMALAQALYWLLLAAEIALAVPVAYLIVVTAAALLTARRRARSLPADPLAGAFVAPTRLPRIAVLVPAHDEE